MNKQVEKYLKEKNIDISHLSKKYQTKFFKTMAPIVAQYYEYFEKLPAEDKIKYNQEYKNIKNKVNNDYNHANEKMQFKFKMYQEDTRERDFKHNGKNYIFSYEPAVPMFAKRKHIENFAKQKIVVGSKEIEQFVDALRHFKENNGDAIDSMDNYMISALHVMLIEISDYKPFNFQNNGGDINNAPLHGAIVLHDKTISNKNIDIEYVKNNKKIGSCVYDGILNTYYEIINKPRDRTQGTIGKDIRNLMTYEGLYKLFNNTDIMPENPDYGVSAAQLGHLFFKLGLALKCYDFYGNLCYEYDPPKPNKKITPRTFQCKISQNHLFIVDKPMSYQYHHGNLKVDDIKVSNSFNLNHAAPTKKIITIIDGFKNISKYIFEQCKVHMPTPNIYDEDPKIDYQQLLNQCLDNEEPAQTFNILTNESTNDLILDFYHHNHLPLITKNITLYFNKLTFNITQLSSSHGITVIENQEQYDLFNDMMYVAKFTILKPKYISYFNAETAEMYKLYKNANYYGVVPGSEYTNNMHLIDFNKFYTSILMNIKEVPIIHAYNNFEQYNSEPINAIYQYYVKCSNPNIIYGSTYNIVDGQTIIEYGPNTPEGKDITIMAYIKPFATCKTDFKSVVASLYERDKYGDAKKIMNRIIGQLGKYKNVVYKTCITNNETEASHHETNYKSQNYNLGPDTYLCMIRKKEHLVDGFLLLRTMIYCAARRQLHKLSKLAEQHNLKVVAYNTDCIYVSGDITEFKKLDIVGDATKSAFDNIGKVKVEKTEKQLKKTLQYNSNFDILKINKPIITPIEIKNEWDISSPDNEFSKLPSLTLITARYPGCGKSESLKQSMKRFGNILFASPYNALSQSIKRSGVDSITVHKLLRLSRRRQRENGKCDMSKYSVIVIDEIALCPVPILSKLQRVMDKNPKIKWYATADSAQLKAIEEKDVKTQDGEATKCLNSMFNYYVELRTIKRIKDETSRARAMEIYDKLKEFTSPKLAVQYLISEKIIKTVDKLADVKTTTNIAQYNSSCAKINSLFEVGKDVIRDNTLYICKRRRAGVNKELYLNYEYRVHSIGEMKEEKKYVCMKPNDIPAEMLEQEKRFIEQKEFLNHFDAGYCRTIYSFQGWSIDQEFTIFDYQHCDMAFLYTAITRTTDLNKVYIYTGNELAQEVITDKCINTRIELHKRADIEANRPIDKNYIETEHVRMLLKIPRCWACARHVEKNNFSIDRIDDSIAHLVGNCRLSCGTCNFAKTNKIV